MKRTILLLLAILLMLGSQSAFAQAKGALTVKCNVTGARVYLNNELAGYTKPNFSVLLKPGTYTLKVTLDKYKPFSTSITMTSNPLILNVALEPEGGAVQQVQPAQPTVTRHNLTVTANVAGALVFVGNAQVGKAPLSMQVDAGSYTIRVTAPGFQDYVANVNVSGNTAVNAQLNASMVQLTVNCNIFGAQVYLNNALVGTTPHTGQYTPGNYAVRVVAPGYSEASTAINLTKNETLTIMLQPAFVAVSINIPQAYLDPQNKNALAQIKVFIDGQFFNSFNFQLPAGKHNIRITSGGLSFAADYEFAAGQSYLIEPAFSWTVKQ